MLLNATPWVVSTVPMGFLKWSVIMSFDIFFAVTLTNVEHTVELPVIWDVMTVIRCRCNDKIHTCCQLSRLRVLDTEYNGAEWRSPIAKPVNQHNQAKRASGFPEVILSSVQDERWGPYNDVTWTTWRVKSLAILQFFKRLFWHTSTKTSISSGPLTLNEGNPPVTQQNVRRIPLVHDFTLNNG